MGKIMEIAEALWREEIDTYSYHPFGPPYGIESVATGTWFYKGQSNTIIRETDDGLVIIDPGAFFDAKDRFRSVRTVSQHYLNTAIYTHGHLDHVFGVEEYSDESKSKGLPRPQVIAHEGVPAFILRMREMAPWLRMVNERQFGGRVDRTGSGKRVSIPTEYISPDIVYRESLTVRIGGVKMILKHAKGETDDHSWIYFPDIGLLCTGDLFTWAVPNAGNPQKTQRYAKEWALGLREMASMEPEILAPGHGFPIIGKKRIKQALEDTADFLESLHKQTLAFMNDGASLDEVVHKVKAPDELLQRPYLQPVYDDPEFIVRNIWRLYGGWYDGTPSRLKPASDRVQAEEVARLAGGANILAARAVEVMSEGNLRLACHLADWAYLTSPEDTDIRKVVRRVYMERAATEPSTMAMGIYLSVASEMEDAPVTDKPGFFHVISEQNKRGKITEKLQERS